MSFNLPQVFISSTSEFAAERQELARTLKSLPDFDFHPFIYEEEAAGSYSGMDHCRKMLDDSEIVVLILGGAYGTSFKEDPSMSIVEWEYEYAKEAKKELKGYVQDPPAAKVDDRQAEFIARVRDFATGTWVRMFAQAPQLIAHVIADVKKWRLDSWKHFRESAAERNRWKDWAVLLACAAIALATVGGVIVGAVLNLHVGQLFLILATGVAMLGCLFLLLKSGVL